MSLATRILAELDLGPAATPDLVERCAAGVPTGRSQVWVVLTNLRDAGLIVCTDGRARRKTGFGANQPVKVWRLAGKPAAELTDLDDYDVEL